MATRAAILDTAHQVFKESGYYGSSVSEITRRCRISMGNFYLYFKNKEQLFLELNDLITSRFVARTGSLPPESQTFEKRFREAVRLLYEHAQENFAFHRILGESDLTDRVTIAYYETLARFFRNFLRAEAQRGRIRALDPTLTAYGLIGICYFNSLDWGPAEKNLPPSQTVDFIAALALRGIAGPASWKRPKDSTFLLLPEPTPLRSVKADPLTKGEKTRQAIFRAAEIVFGQRGFNRANISEITREAGVAQGTFYIHFSSKRDLIEGFVKYINHQLRRELQRATAGIQDRRDIERVGILAFYKFLRRHRQIYRVVPECEMIDREVGLWYYSKMAQGYIEGLKGGIARKEIRSFPPVFLARSLMGFTHFIGLKGIVWAVGSKPGLPRRSLRDLLEFLLFGLKKEGNGSFQKTPPRQGAQNADGLF
ncbi:MAG: Transcriptional regulator, AcrR family [Deltaproteobacteria bacterium]|jgi:AcrR family transcriptional regulator|nr:Transcriptional regulator, AcrR family [Deltaproteobacteria bacterium]